MKTCEFEISVLPGDTFLWCDLDGSVVNEFINFYDPPESLNCVSIKNPCMLVSIENDVPSYSGTVISKLRFVDCKGTLGVGYFWHDQRKEYYGVETEEMQNLIPVKVKKEESK